MVDLRLNDGGDFFNTILFAQALPKLIASEGRIFVLVGPSTFSAALVTAAMLKQYGAHRVVLVGEPMGDRRPFWSEGLPVMLPNSKIEVRPAVWMQNWEDGCNDRSRCYWANTVFGGKPVSLQPELRIPLRFADYAAGRDSVLDAALSAAR